MKYKILLIAGIALAPFAAPSAAEAGVRCKTYTKSIVIDGKRQAGYGKACLRADGLWEIVNTSGTYAARDAVTDRIYDDLYDDGYRIVGAYDRDYYAPRKYVRRYVRHSKPYKYSHAYKHYKHHKNYAGHDCKDRSKNHRH